MDIMIQEVRIKNFRSIQNLTLQLGMTNILIGPNNSGKSNFLHAIDIAINGARDVSEFDIYQSTERRVSKADKAIIDILIRPIDSAGNPLEDFSDFWNGVFTESWIAIEEFSYVGIRTVIEYNQRNDAYALKRFPLRQWGNSIDDAIEDQIPSFNQEMRDYVHVHFMDAHRDIVEDLRNKKSYFGKTTAQHEIDKSIRVELENDLNRINDKIIESIPSIHDTAKELNRIGTTLGNRDGGVKIEPLARRLEDLHKGMDITFKDGNAATFPIGQHGMGTRSWVSFLTLSAFVNWDYKQVQLDESGADTYVLLELEEPEAHLHPQAQKQIYKQLLDFQGQKIASTHSPDIVAQVDLKDIVHFIKTDGKTEVIKFPLKENELEAYHKIKREVLRSKGSLLFSQAVILAEGITEEQALPIFFKEYFGTEPEFLGISIIGIGGQNYETFLKLLHPLRIPWFIFSDGEDKTIKTITKLRNIFYSSNESSSNIIVLDNGCDYERYLIANNYGKNIIQAINTVEGNENFFSDFIKSRNHTSSGRVKTDKPKCPTCKQFIYEDVIRNYDDADGQIQAIYDCATGKNAKAKYAIEIAATIVSNNTPDKRIPPKIKELFESIQVRLHIDCSKEYRDE